VKLVIMCNDEPQSGQPPVVSDDLVHSVEA
jgi:hypothetical protein